MIIKINKLKVNTIIGVYEKERVEAQDIYINAKIQIKDDGVKTDDIDDTLDYYTLSNEIHDKVSQTKFELLEKLVDFVLNLIMDKPQAKSAEVEIIKYPEDLKSFVESISVTGKSTLQ